LTSNASTLDASGDYLSLSRQAEEKFLAKEYAQAAALWERALALNPHVTTWAALGRAHYLAKEYAPAIRAYERALELGAGYRWESAYNIACCYALQARKAEALDWLAKAMDLGFRDLTQVQKDEDLQALHGEKRFQELALIADVEKMSRVEGWRFDLKVLARELKRLHHAPLTHTAPPAFEEAVRKLHDSIPKLSDDEIAVGFMHLFRLMGDAHTRIGPKSLREGEHRLPLQFYLFEGSLYIIAADDAHADLAGAQVLRVGEKTVPQLMDAFDPIISQDNRMWPLMVAPNLLRCPQVMHGLKLIPAADQVALIVRDVAGKERAVTLAATAGDVQPTWTTAYKNAQAPIPLTLKNRQAAYWYEYLPDTKTVFCQYNAVRNDPNEPLDKFCARLFAFINANTVEKLVLDMRWNGGGNNFLNKPLVEGLMRCDKINQQGKLFVVIGRNTFSAAQCGVTQIERYTNAIFVGEPTGSCPNFIGESIPISLPYSKMQGTVSDLYWQNSVAMDYRTWIAPELYAPPTFALYRANRDPATEAILAYHPAP